ncbi:MAG: hypothetical protein BVN33_06900 [Proteobacteria bacterium ST_bin13]|nr:MAG: hypothetical protein BVN33_06900 [Proteobacteria bacterium ST_bin13]
MRKAKAALLAVLILCAPVSAEVSTDTLFELTRSHALVLIGLSPPGAGIYARRAVAFSEKKDRFAALSRLKVLMGEELAREAPDRLRVEELSKAVAQEEARDARLRYEELIKTAFQLSVTDRQKLGKMIARNNGSSLHF